MTLQNDLTGNRTVSAYVEVIFGEAKWISGWQTAEEGNAKFEEKGCFALGHDNTSFHFG